MASIEIRNASVSYFMRNTGGRRARLERGSVGAPIVAKGRYLEIAALREINLSLRDGDRVGLIGLNGSGKSTLLKLCAGALATQSGSVSVEGKVSPQFSLGAGIRGALTGRRNTELKCLYMGTPQRSIPARVEEIRKLCGLGGYFELPVSSYSAGMRSRLIMSMLKLVRPEILIMDEWIGAADATVNKTLSGLKKELIEASSILLLASHSRQVLGEWTNSLLWLDQGQVMAHGPVDEVYSAFQAWSESR